MTISTDVKLEPGKVYKGLNRRDGSYDPEQPFLVLGPSTYEKYVETCKEFGATWIPEKTMKTYWEVSVD